MLGGRNALWMRGGRNADDARGAQRIWEGPHRVGHCRCVDVRACVRCSPQQRDDGLHDANSVRMKFYGLWNKLAHNSTGSTGCCKSYRGRLVYQQRTYRACMCVFIPSLLTQDGPLYPTCAFPKTVGPLLHSAGAKIAIAFWARGEVGLLLARLPLSIRAATLHAQQGRDFAFVWLGGATLFVDVLSRPPNVSDRQDHGRY